MPFSCIPHHIWLCFLHHQGIEEKHELGRRGEYYHLPTMLSPGLVAFHALSNHNSTKAIIINSPHFTAVKLGFTELRELWSWDINPGLAFKPEVCQVYVFNYIALHWFKHFPTPLLNWAPIKATQKLKCLTPSGMQCDGLLVFQLQVNRRNENRWTTAPITCCSHGANLLNIELLGSWVLLSSSVFFLYPGQCWARNGQAGSFCWRHEPTPECMNKANFCPLPLVSEVLEIPKEKVEKSYMWAALICEESDCMFCNIHFGLWWSWDKYLTCWGWLQIRVDWQVSKSLSSHYGALSRL